MAEIGAIITFLCILLTCLMTALRRYCNRTNVDHSATTTIHIVIADRCEKGDANQPAKGPPFPIAVKRATPPVYRQVPPPIPPPPENFYTYFTSLHCGLTFFFFLIICFTSYSVFSIVFFHTLLG